MLIILFSLFVIGPIAEIAVLLQAGGLFGFWPVVIACVGTAIIGGWVIRLQGLAAINAAHKDLAEGKMPIGSAVNGALIAAAAPFLMTPGFITDFFGFALLIPPVRMALARFAVERLRRYFERNGRVIVVDKRP